MEILACPICKDHPLKLHMFEEKEEVTAGIIECKSCQRWYPIIDEIPHMLPDDLREKKEDLEFLKKWKQKTPRNIIDKGKPFTL
jgi:uncharacterized protein YbaR (Trm112 family)